MDRTVVFVCSGNTCRSPLAEAVAKARCGGSVQFLSAGLDAVPGSPASTGTCDEAADLGLDVTAHRSQRLHADLVAEAHWLVAMTGRHAARLLEAWPDARVGKLGRPLVALRPDDDLDDGEDVDDPFRKGTELAYTLMAEQVARLTAAWCDALGEETP